MLTFFSTIKPRLHRAERGFHISQDAAFLSQSAGGPAAFFAGAAVAFYVDVVGVAFRTFQGVIYRFHCYYIGFFLTVLFFAFHFFLFHFFFIFLAYAQDVASAAAVAEYGDSFAAAFPGGEVDAVDVFRGGTVFQVHGAGDGVIHVFLHGCLHADAVHEGDVVAFDDPGEAGHDFFIGNGEGQVVVFQKVFDAVGVDPEMAVHFFHFVGGAFIGNLVERFAAAGEAAHEEGDGAGGSDGKEGAVPKAMLMDVFIELRIQFFHHVHDGRFLRGFPAVVAEGAFFLCPVAGGAEGGEEHGFHDAAHEVIGFFGAVCKFHGDEGVCHAEEAEAQGAPVIDAGSVGVQGLSFIAVVHDFIQSGNAVVHGLFEPFFVKYGAGAELVVNHGVKVHAAQVAGVVCIAAEFAAGVGDFNVVFVVACQEVVFVHPVNKDGTGVAPVPLGFAEFFEKFAGFDGSFDFFAGGFHGEAQGIFLVVPHGFHEFIGEKDADVHGGQLFFVLFDMKEFVNIGMAAVQAHHHGAPPSVLADDFTGDVENLQEGNGAGGAAGHVPHFASLGAEVGNIDADAAAVGEDTGNFIVGPEYGFQVIFRGRQDVAVGHGYLEFSLGPCRIKGAARRAEGGVFQVAPHPLFQLRIKNGAHPVHEFIRSLFSLVIVFFFQDALTDCIVVPVVHMNPSFP